MFMIEKPAAISRTNPVSSALEFEKGNEQPREINITSKESENGKEDKSISIPQIEIMVEDLDYGGALYDVNLKYSFHQKSGKVIISVVDRNSGELIREIPHEEILKLASRMEEISGRIFDKMV
jgi:flagellar protein FlaG